ncbi:Peptidase family C54 domain containing protein [Lactarius tabidus]
MRKLSKLSGVKETSSPPHDADVSEDFTRVVQLMSAKARRPSSYSPLRVRAERPLSSVSDNHISFTSHHTLHPASPISPPDSLADFSTPSTLPPRIFPCSISSTPFPLPPASQGQVVCTVDRHKTDKGHLDKAMRYLLDSDSTPIWLLGVQHTSYEPAPGEAASPTLSRSGSVNLSVSRLAIPFHASTPSILRVAAPLSGNNRLSSSQTSSKNPGAHWPPEFYADFTSLVWITSRSRFYPIRDSSLTVLEREQAEAAASGVPTPIPSSPPSKRWWPGGEKGWTSDAGWGYMLRTGQSLLATALIHLHLGREWRRPPHPVYTTDYATYVQILTWFFDSPSVLCPFSVHRMALAGKELGKDVGQLFGPSTAAGAIKSLVQNFPDASLGISVAVDGQIIQTDVYSASYSPNIPRPRKLSRWGDRAVVVLICIRLGIDGVNPIYYETIKALYTLPQSVGIAGGRASSSYYFVGSQADNLFYLDPHHTRATIPLRPPTQTNERERERGIQTRQAMPERGSVSPPGRHRSPTSPASSRTGLFTLSYPTASLSPLSKQLSTNSSSRVADVHWNSAGANGGRSVTSVLSDEVSDAGLDPTQVHYVTSYSAAELRTFHCERVRKMPLSGLHPSMLIGFLCKTEADWIDLRDRVAENHKAIFSIVDELPSWSDADDSHESMSDLEEDEDDMPDDKHSSRSGGGDRYGEGDAVADVIAQGDGSGDIREDDDEDSSDDFFDASEGACDQSGSGGGNEDDPVGPVTPSAANTKTLAHNSKPIAVDFTRTISPDSVDLDDEEWVDPTPIPATSLEPAPPAFPPPIVKTKSPSSAKSQKPKEASVYAPFPSNVTQGAQEDRPRRVPQMSTSRGRNGGRTQSGGVKGVIAPDFGPAEPDDPNGDDFQARTRHTLYSTPFTLSFIFASFFNTEICTRSADLAFVCLFGMDRCEWLAGDVTVVRIRRVIPLWVVL